MIISLNNDLYPARRQTIVWAKASWLSIKAWGTNFNENSSIKKMRLKRRWIMAATWSQPQYAKYCRDQQTSI